MRRTVMRYNRRFHNFCISPAKKIGPNRPVTAMFRPLGMHGLIDGNVGSKINADDH